MGERKQIAIREWIDDAGKPVDEEKATGGKYTLLATKESVSFFPKKKGNEKAAEMLAIFGFITLMGNEVSQAADGLEIANAKARLELLVSGDWVDRSGGGGGIRYDKDKLAQAMASVLKGKVEDYRAKMDWRVIPATGVRAAENEKGPTILYGTRALRRPDIKAAYDKLVPAAPVAVPDAGTF